MLRSYVTTKITEQKLTQCLLENEQNQLMLSLNVLPTLQHLPKTYTLLK